MKRLLLLLGIIGVIVAASGWLPGCADNPTILTGGDAEIITIVINDTIYIVDTVVTTGPLKVKMLALPHFLEQGEWAYGYIDVDGGKPPFIYAQYIDDIEQYTNAQFDSIIMADTGTFVFEGVVIDSTGAYANVFDVIHVAPRSIDSADCETDTVGAILIAWPDTVGVGETVKFRGCLKGCAPMTFSVSINGTPFATTLEGSIDFDAPGEYLLRLAGTDAIGRPFSDTELVVVLEAPPCRLETYALPSTVRQGDSVHVLGIVSCPIDSARWYVEDSWLTNNLRDHVIMTIVGTFVLRLDVYPTGGGMLSDQVLVRVVPPDTVALDSCRFRPFQLSADVLPDTVVAGTAVTVTGWASGCEPLDYRWDIGTVTVSTQRQDTVTAPSTPGSYQVRFIASDAIGRVDTVLKTLTVISAMDTCPPPTNRGIVLPGMVFLGDTAYLDGLSTGCGVTDQWLLNGTQIAGQAEAKYAPPDTGLYSFTFRSVDQFGRTVEDIANISVVRQPTPGVDTVFITNTEYDTVWVAQFDFFDQKAWRLDTEYPAAVIILDNPAGRYLALCFEIMVNCPPPPGATLEVILGEEATYHFTLQDLAGRTSIIGAIAWSWGDSEPGVLLDERQVLTVRVTDASGNDLQFTGDCYVKGYNWWGVNANPNKTARGGTIMWPSKVTKNNIEHIVGWVD